MVDPSSAQTVRENLLYIRKTLEAAGQITAVPGRCLLAAGFFPSRELASIPSLPALPGGRTLSSAGSCHLGRYPLRISLVIVSIGIYRKSRQTCTPIQPPLLRKLLWSLCPALFVGGLLTSLAVRSQQLEWLPVIWLGCYGAAVTNGGQVSVAPVRYMGLSFLLAAAGAALSPPEAGLAWLALGIWLAAPRLWSVYRQEAQWLKNRKRRVLPQTNWIR